MPHVFPHHLPPCSVFDVILYMISILNQCHINIFFLDLSPHDHIHQRISWNFVFIAVFVFSQRKLILLKLLQSILLMYIKLSVFYVFPAISIGWTISFLFLLAILILLCSVPIYISHFLAVVAIHIVRSVSSIFIILNEF